jgi:hypothetical protein
MLTGTALKETVAAMQAEGKKPTEIAIACGYCTVEGSNTKVHFTDFYMALLEVKGETVDDIEEETIEAEDSDNQEAINEALEDYPADAVRAFIEYFGEDCISDISDSYQGEMSGAEFAEQLVSDCYSLDIPSFVSIDWADTWDNLRHDYAEQDGFIFCTNF